MGNDVDIAMIISPNRGLHDELEAALRTAAVVDTIWVAPNYPELAELERLKEVPKGCVLFLDFSDPARARRIAAHIDRFHPRTTMVAIHSGPSKDDLIALMQLGIREVISDPVLPADVAFAFARALRKLNGSDPAPKNLFAFLPAKPGSGATTIVTNVAWMVARLSQARALLLDFDLRLGITSFLMKLDGRHSIEDALNESRHLDHSLWEKLVCRRDNLDALGSGPCELPSDIPTEAFTAVLDFAQDNYASICVDLPGSLEPYEVETLRRAKEIFLVCNADVAGLHMAKRKAEALHRLGLVEAVTVVLNRVERRAALPITDIEHILNLPVRFVVPSDSKGVARSVQAGLSVDMGSATGSQIAAIAKSIIGGNAASPSRPLTQRFVEYFSISPVRELNSWKR